MKTILQRVLLPVLAVFILGIGIRPAFAVGDLYLKTTGPGPQQVTLDISSALGKPTPPDEDRRADVTHIRDLQPGTYNVVVSVDGEKKAPQQITVRDGKVNSYTVDRRTGIIAAAPVPPQQQSSRFSVGFLGGIKRTPFNADVTSFSLNSQDSGDLEDTIGVYGIEARYYLGRRMQQLGAEMFLFGTYLHYTGGPLARLFGDRHPTPGADVGADVEERDSLNFGFGINLNVLQRLGLGLMIGGHATRVAAAVLADESGGGGVSNRFTNRETVFGPLVAVELFYTLGWLQAIGPVQLALRSTFKYLPGVDVHGVSTTNRDYDGRINGGVQTEVLAGLRFLF